MTTAKGSSIQKKEFDYSFIETEEVEELKTIAVEVKSLLKQTLENVINVGRLLRKAKEKLGHGYFQSWCESEFTGGDYIHDTITNWINLARMYDEEPEYREHMQLMPMYSLYKLSRSSVEKELKDVAFQLAAEKQPLTRKETDEVIKAYRKVRLEGSGVAEEAKILLEDNPITENLKELKQIARLSKTKQIAVANLIAKGAASTKKEAIKAITAQSKQEQENDTIDTVVAEIKGISTKHYKGTLYTALKKIPAESLNCVIVEAPLKTAFVINDLNKLTVALDKVCAPGAFVLMTVGHKAIFYSGDRFSPFEPAHALVLRRQPGNSSSIVGLNVISASVLVALLYKPPYRKPDSMLVDLQTMTDTEAAQGLDEVHSGLENCFDRFLTALLKPEDKIGHIIIGDHFSIRESLIEIAEKNRASEFVTVG